MSTIAVIGTLDVTANCALLDRDGAVSRRLFAVGPVTKGAFWEMTAVPDIRRQSSSWPATWRRWWPRRPGPLCATGHSG